MLFSSRRDDDADVIRARLRAVLGGPADGWLPDDDPAGDHDHDHDRGAGDATQRRHRSGTPGWDDEDDPDDWSIERATTDPGAVAPRSAAGDQPAAPAEATGRHRASGPAARVAPGPRSARTLWVAAVVAAVLVAGGSWLGRPAVEPVATGATPADAAPADAVPAASTGAPTGPTAPATGADSPTEIVVDVVGLVVAPGLVTLPAGSRVADAVAAAGGLLPEADPATINAASLLDDGQQVAVGVPGAVASGPVSSGAGSAPSGPVDLNTATVADLDALPGLGPVLAQRILDHRDQQGPFQSVEQLDDVSGIGPALYAQIAPLVTV